MNEITKKRRPFLAAFLSVLVTGLGQLYNGQHKRAIAYYAALNSAALLLMAILTSELVEAFTGLILSMVITLCIAGIFLTSNFDAYRRSCRFPAIFLTKFTQWYVYLAVLLIVFGFNFTMDMEAERLTRTASYNLPSRSMHPNLLQGDYLIAKRSAYSDRLPTHGEIVLFKNPKDGKTDMIRRVIALPGDQIELRKGRFYRNGEAVTRGQISRPPGYSTTDYGGKSATFYLETMSDEASYMIMEEIGEDWFNDIPVYDVPDDQFFVLGDNRDNSIDSHVFGFVPIKNLTDRPLYLYWSSDWSRIGMAVQ